MQNIPLALKRSICPHLLKNHHGKEETSMAGKTQRRFTCFAVFSLLLLSIFQCSDIHRSAAEASEVMPVTIRASARWEDITRDENGEALYKDYGFFTVSISGTMTLRNSPVVTSGGQMVMPTENYAPENLTVSAIYEERTENMRPPEDRECSNPVTLKYQGSYFANITEGPSLTICNFSSAAAPFMKDLSPKEKEFAAQINSNMMPDFYQLAIGGGDLAGPPREPKVTGFHLTSDCDLEQVEKAFPGFSIGMQMKLPPSGSMSGYRIWDADTDGMNPPSFGIHVSDMADHGGEAPYHPAEGGRRNVTYSISWNFGGHSPAPGATAESDDEEEEDDCKELQRRVNEISVIMAAYSNASIRDYINDQNIDLATKKQIYQEAVENAFMDANKNNSEVADRISHAANVDGESVTPPFESRDPSGGTGNDLEDDGGTLCQSEALEKKQSQTNMEAVAGGNLDGGENVWGHDLGSVTIVDHCTGSPVQIEVYDRNGNVVYNQGVHDAVACWQEKYGDEAGRSRFEASLEHERTHVDQYVKNGPIDSIDELAQRELEAYQKEMNEILEDMMDLDC